MNASAPPLPLADVLDALLACGDRLEEALDAQEIGHLGSLLAERGTLLDTLRAYTPPTPGHPRWRPHAEAFEAQDRRLQQKMAALEQHLGSALGTVDRYKEAHQGYRAPAPAGGILNKNLRV